MQNIFLSTFMILFEMLLLLSSCCKGLTCTTATPVLFGSLLLRSLLLLFAYAALTWNVVKRER